NARFNKFLWVTLDYQFVINPAYNKDRGPVHVFGIRGHVEF
ncbi:carbohydrate porin, partial [Escherichia coli]